MGLAFAIFSMWPDTQLDLIKDDDDEFSPTSPNDKQWELQPRTPMTPFTPRTPYTPRTTALHTLDRKLPKRSRFV